MVIYHNPRCSKSRQCLALIEEKSNSKALEVVKYLETPFSKEQLKNVIELLGITPIELVRKNEKIWKEEFKGKELSDEEIVEAMILHPKLIERPIVVHGTKAIIGRPPEKVLDLM